MTGLYPSSQHSVLPVPCIEACWKLSTHFFSRILHYEGHCLPSLHLTSALAYPHLPVYLGLFKSLPLISRLSLSSKWFSNLPALGQTSNWIPKFLPTNREHRISNFALRHDNSQFILCRAQIVVGLITKTDLVPRTI